MAQRHQVTQLLPLVFSVSCGLGGALSNLTLFPRSAFVLVKLSGLTGRRCPAHCSCHQDGQYSTNPPVQESAPAAGMGERTSPFRSGPRLLFSHRHCPRDAGVRSLLTTTIWPFSFGDMLLPSVLSWLCWPLLAAVARLFLPCTARRAPSSPFSTDFLDLPWSFGLSIVFCRGGKSPPLLSWRGTGWPQAAGSRVTGRMSLRPPGSHHLFFPAVPTPWLTPKPGLCCSALSAALASCWEFSSMSAPLCSETQETIRLLLTSSFLLYTAVPRIKFQLLRAQLSPIGELLKSHVLCSVYGCVFRSVGFCVWNSPLRWEQKQAQGCAGGTTSLKFAKACAKQGVGRMSGCGWWLRGKVVSSASVCKEWVCLHAHTKGKGSIAHAVRRRLHPLQLRAQSKSVVIDSAAAKVPVQSHYSYV